MSGLLPLFKSFRAEKGNPELLIDLQMWTKLPAMLS